jgi:hypothetical protein
MDRRDRGLPSAPGDFFVGTTTGKRRDEDRFRDRILSRAVEHAGANQTELGLPPLPAISDSDLVGLR